MSNDEFDQLTPADWVLYFRQWKKKVQREDLRAARVCRAILQVAGVKCSINDFMSDPIKFKKLPKRKIKEAPPAVIERQFLALFPKSANLKPKWQPTQ